MNRNLVLLNRNIARLRRDGSSDDDWAPAPLVRSCPAFAGDR
jgi:hypothetical protein